MSPNHLAPLSSYAGWAAWTPLSNSLSGADVPKTTQSTAAAVHCTYFSCHAAHVSFSSHELEIGAAVLALMTQSGSYRRHRLREAWATVMLHV